MVPQRLGGLCVCADREGWQEVSLSERIMVPAGIGKAGSVIRLS